MAVLNFSASTINLVIYDFNQLPREVTVKVDVQAIIIDQTGLTQSSIDGEFDFISDQINNIGIARSQWEHFTINQGFNNEYIARNNISTTLLGRFDLSANSTFNFQLTSALNLQTFTTNPINNSLSSSGRISLALQNSANQEIIDYFDLFALINTNPTDSESRDYFTLRSSPNFTITEYNTTSILGNQLNSEFFSVETSVSFERYFYEPTLINLIAITESCNYTSTNINTCVKVNEPSNHIPLILLLFLLLWGGISRSRIMKHITYFSH
ncbi:hypothetical protein Cyast_0652 [Cyanobacterium stanieri PCC 7202]|uniref:Uncharacterized protein n=1 Tax=Cyanobacterium stanieri (strain ATCC 29140 / PCC 7202) TaxID=292563 RepID=K9YKK3_CYASC|nr:hypothetical protein Cyast_0652 [Cyanobacterium stanieri PCC 7202]